MCIGRELVIPNLWTKTDGSEENLCGDGANYLLSFSEKVVSSHVY